MFTRKEPIIINTVQAAIQPLYDSLENLKAVKELRENSISVKKEEISKLQLALHDDTQEVSAAEQVIENLSKLLGK